RGTIGGLALLVDPSGALVGLPTAPLASTPFADFLVPGLVLGLLFGVGSALAGYGLLARRGWATPAAAAVALALVAWLAVEVAVGFHRPTVYLNLATAAGVLALSRHRPVRRDLSQGSG
nr:hypothetical protein [Gemmatimonadota bacterium]NIS34271.1 hypothetical protein [Actinomycetota bacterium]NIU69053.1 hypothetical protein [Actinomycetota bacterium]NIW30912.1 hypothetical protein [Actinomycetota bacterium]NIX23286.1 hypothetical protein [Actinomycetota bacterium]